MVVAQRSEPKTLNPVFAIDEPSRAVTGLMGAPLVRLNPKSLATEGVLAESWKTSTDGREITVRLRRGLKFSDGSPLTAGDVLFTFDVHINPKTASPQRELLTVGGQPVQVALAGPDELRFTLAEPYALGEKMLAGISILPAKHLAEAYRGGRLAATWGLGTASAGIAGAGPFRLKSIQPGERIVLERNPHYSKRDPAGRPLPYLDEVEFVFAANEDAMTARFTAGEADLVAGFGPGSYSVLTRAGERMKHRVLDLGAGLDYTFLLFNLNPAPETAAAPRKWFQRQAFRQAISAAIDRQAIVKLVYRGRATPLWGHVTPARGHWMDESLPRPPGSASRSRELLRRAGFRWDSRGLLVDENAVAVEFTIVANAANPVYTQTAAIIEEDLKPLGIKVQVVPLEFRSLVDRVTNRRDFDAAVMALRPGEADPVADMNVLMSAGSTRLWNMSGKPVFAWEGEIDGLMRRQIGTTGAAQRKSDFDQVQRILAGQLPFIPLASPNVLVAAREALGNLRPGAIGHPVLWNADEIFWSHAGNQAPRP